MTDEIDPGYHAPIGSTLTPPEQLQVGSSRHRAVTSPPGDQGKGKVDDTPPPGWPTGTTILPEPVPAPPTSTRAWTPPRNHPVPPVWGKWRLTNPLIVYNKLQADGVKVLAYLCNPTSSYAITSIKMADLDPVADLGATVNIHLTNDGVDSILFRYEPTIARNPDHEQTYIVVAIPPLKESTQQVPDYTQMKVDGEWAMVLDPELDPSLTTKYFSESPALIYADYLASPIYGEGQPLDEVYGDPSLIMAKRSCAADIGGVPRYVMGLQQESDDPANVRQRIRAHAALNVAHNNGRFVYWIDEKRPLAPVTLTDGISDGRKGEANILSVGDTIVGGRKDVPNRIRINFINPDPAADYKQDFVFFPDPMPPGQIEILSTYELGQMTSDQASRLAKLYYKRAQLDETTPITVMPDVGEQLLPGVRLQVTAQRPNWANQDVLVTTWSTSSDSTKPSQFEGNLELYDEEIYDDTIVNVTPHAHPASPSPYDPPPEVTEIDGAVGYVSGASVWWSWPQARSTALYGAAYWTGVNCHALDVSKVNDGDTSAACFDWNVAGASSLSIDQGPGNTIGFCELAISYLAYPGNYVELWYSDDAVTFTKYAGPLSSKVQTSAGITTQTIAWRGTGTYAIGPRRAWQIRKSTTAAIAATFAEVQFRTYLGDAMGIAEFRVRKTDGTLLWSVPSTAIPTAATPLTVDTAATHEVSPYGLAYGASATLDLRVSSVSTMGRESEGVEWGVRSSFLAGGATVTEWMPRPESNLAIAAGLNSDLALPNGAGEYVLQLTADSSIGGLTPGVTGDVVKFRYAGNQTLTIVNNDAASSAGNRIATGYGVNVALRGPSTVWFQKDVSGVWNVTLAVETAYGAGAAAKALALISDRQSIKYDNTGALSPASQTTTFTAVKQNTTAAVTWTMTQLDGTAITAGTYLSATSGDVVTMTAANFDAARGSTLGVIVIGTLTDGATVTDKISVVKVQDGATGAAAKTLYVISDRQGITYDGTGALSPASQTTTFAVVKQNTTAVVTWTMTRADGSTISAGSYLSATSGDSVTMTAANFDAARGSTLGVVVIATLTDGATLTDEISIVKVQNGATAKTLYVISDRQAITYDTTGTLSPASQTTTFTAVKQNTTAVVTWTMTRADGSTISAGSYLSATSGDSVTMTAANFDAARGTTPGVVVIGTLTDGSTLTDKISILKTQDGPGLSTLSPQSAGTITFFSPNSFAKTSGTFAFDAGVYSLQGYQRGAFVTFQVAQTNQHVVIGLNTDPTTDADVTGIDFAWYCNSFGNAQIVESGTAVSSYTGSAYTTSTVFLITYDGAYVRYFRDGVLQRSFLRALGSPLYLDSSIYHPTVGGAQVTNIAFGPMGEQGPTPISVQPLSMAAVGGRVLVGPTTKLSLDVATSDTSITVDAAVFANGDRIVLQTAPTGAQQTEYMAVTSAVSGTGPYTYSVTRDLDGSGADSWKAGDAVVGLGQAGNGFIDIYSAVGLKSAGEVGPTIVGNVRNSATYNDWTPRWVIGNLNGLFGYVTNTYGAAFGIPTGAWLKIDPTNGVRIGFNATTKIQIDASGSASFSGSITVGSGTIGGWTIGASKLTSGSVTIDGANSKITTTGVTIDGNGLTLTGGSTAYLSFSDGGGLWGGGSGFIFLGASGINKNIWIDVGGGSGAGTNCYYFTIGGGQGLKMGSTKVLGPQGAAVAHATNSTDVITQLNALIDRLSAAAGGHGLIA